MIWVLLDYWHDFEGQVNIVANSVGHQLEHSIRWDESDGAVSVESAQADALVELNIVDLNSAVLLSGVGGRILDEQLVVDAELALWHAS